MHAPRVTTHHYLVPPLPTYFVPVTMANVKKQETAPSPPPLLGGVERTSPSRFAPEPDEEDDPILFAQKKNKAQRSAAPQEDDPILFAQKKNKAQRSAAAPIAPPTPEVIEVEKMVVTEKLVEVPTERIVTREVICEVPVERIVTREKIVEVRFMFCCFMLLMHDRHRHACVQIGQINSRMQVACGECC